MRTVNQRITLRARPVGFPRLSDFDRAYELPSALTSGDLLVRSTFLSLDSCLRALMNQDNASVHSVALGQVMSGGAVGVVVESADPQFEVGVTVVGMLGWQELAVVAGENVRKVDRENLPSSSALGILGRPGLTAYFGLLDLCAPKPTETAVISGAAGGIGMVAGQIAGILGCRVVGIATSGSDLSWLRDELGFDTVIAFEDAGDLDQRLRAACPAGIDVYFDTVGGAISRAVLGQINAGARIAVCGQSSQSNLEPREPASRWPDPPSDRRASVQTLQVSSYSGRFPSALAQLAHWLKHGHLRYREEVSQGLEAAPRAFIGMLRGQSQGKQLVQLS